MRTLLTFGVIVMALTLGCAGAKAAPPRDARVHEAAAANRAGALDLLREIVDIDSGTGDVAGGTAAQSNLI